MEGRVGWTTTAFRQKAAVDPSFRWNTLLQGLQASTMLDLGAGQGASSVFCAEKSTIPDTSVHFSACILRQHGPLLPWLPLPDIKQLIFTPRGTRVNAFFRATVRIGMCVPPATSHTKLEIAQRPLIALSTSSTMAPFCRRVSCFFQHPA